MSEDPDAVPEQDGDGHREDFVEEPGFEALAEASHAFDFDTALQLLSRGARTADRAV